MSRAVQALQGAIDLLQRMYESPSFTGTRGAQLIDDELPVLRAALEALSADKGTALATLRDYVERSTHWREGGATRHDALSALDTLSDGSRPKTPCSA